eukprot:scaffold63629_cov63-Phaeocystis_antarctica.AAC.4
MRVSVHELSRGRTRGHAPTQLESARLPSRWSARWLRPARRAISRSRSTCSRSSRRLPRPPLGAREARCVPADTALAFEQPPTSFSGQVPSLVEPASPVPHGADTAAARRASAAERDRERYACELRVLRRTIPELEEALAARDSLLQAPPRDSDRQPLPTSRALPLTRPRLPHGRPLCRSSKR